MRKNIHTESIKTFWLQLIAAAASGFYCARGLEIITVSPCNPIKYKTNTAA